MKRSIVLMTILMLCLPVQAQEAPYAGSFKDPIELVQSFPIGTEDVLKTPGIRFARDVWPDMINEAQKTIEIGAFYVDNKKGEPLAPLIKALEKAAKRGVAIRIVADQLQYKNYPDALDRLGKLENICVHLIDMQGLAGGVMHAKYIIVDTNDVFVGSQNFDWLALKHIREIGIRIRNAQLAKTVQAIFEVDYSLSTPLDPSHECPASATEKNVTRDLSDAVTQADPVTIKQFGEDVEIYPAFSPAKLTYHNLETEEATIVQMMDNAKKEILVQVMEFSPVTYEYKLYTTLENALKRASLRRTEKENVQVKMILANWSIRFPSIGFIQALSIIPYVHIKFSTIPAWKNKCVPFSRVEHAKYMIVDDDMLWIGTGNWTRSYFYGCRNIGFSIKSKQLNKVMRNAFWRDWNGSYTQAVDPIKRYQRPDYQCKYTKKKAIVRIQSRAFLSDSWQ